MISVVSTSQGKHLDLHFKEAGDNEVSLPLMNLSQDIHFLESLPMNTESRHYLYACHWQHKLSTADANDMGYLGLEKVIMTGSTHQMVSLFCKK